MSLPLDIGGVEDRGTQRALETIASEWPSSTTVRGSRSSVQTITTATWTLLTWNAEDWDLVRGTAGTQHDTSSTTARLFARQDGKYQVTLFTSWAANTTGIRVGVIQKNSEALPATANTGVYQGGYAISAPSTSVTTTISAPALVQLNTGDYVAAVVFQNSGGNLDIGTDSYFAMTWIA